MKVILLLNAFKAHKDVMIVLIFLKSQKASFLSLGKCYEKLAL